MNASSDPQLDLYSLRLFVSVCDLGNLARTAEREGLDPSAVTKRIARLEQQLGVQLLLRSRRGVEPTAIGHTFLDEVRDLIQSSDRIAKQFKAFASSDTGAVVLAANATSMAGPLPEDLARFLEQRPRPKIYLVADEMYARDAIAAVREGKASIGVIWDVSETMGLDVLPYMEDQLCCVMHPSHPLACLPNVSYEQTQAYDSVGMRSTRTVENVLERTGMAKPTPSRNRLQVHTYEGALRLVARNLGVLITTRSVVKAYEGTVNVAAVPLSDPWARQRFSLVYRSEALNPLAKQLVEFLAKTRHPKAGFVAS